MIVYLIIAWAGFVLVTKGNVFINKTGDEENEIKALSNIQPGPNSYDVVKQRMNTKFPSFLLLLKHNGRIPEYKKLMIMRISYAHIFYVMKRRVIVCINPITHNVRRRQLRISLVMNFVNVRSSS